MRCGSRSKSRLGAGQFFRSIIALWWIAGAAVCGAQSSPKQPPIPDLGPNVLVFSPDLAPAAMQQQIDKIYAVQQHNEFGTERNAVLFLPGEYHIDVPVGFYTQVIGLGASPDAVHITGNVHADASLPRNNATCTFWRAAEGFSVTPTGGTMQWAVSQAIAFRRMHVLGNLVLHQDHGWASGGWISDSLIDGTVDSGSQQQWLSRNTEWTNWTGSNWNMVFVGVNHPPSGDWPAPPYTKIADTPVIREKPFLHVDKQGHWNIVVPELRTNSSGYYLARWRHSRSLNPARSLLHRSSGRQGRRDKRAGRSWQAFAVHARDLRVGGTHPHYAAQHRGYGPWIRHAEAGQRNRRHDHRR